MNKQEQLNYDKKVLASLEAEYKRAQRVIYSIRELVTDLNFEELMPDSQERCLMVDELQAYDYIRTNLMNRIRFYRNRVKLEENKEKIAEHLEHEQREFMPVLDKMNKTFQLPAFSNINQEKFEAFQKGDISLQEFLESVPCNESFLKAVVQYLTDEQHHCGQDAASQAEDGPAESPESLKDLLGMEVVCVGDMPCDGCPHDHYGAPCVKVELVGGYHICLAAHPNSIISE